MMVFYLCLPQRLFPEVRLFTASLANFFFAHFHAASTEATKAETLLCLAFDPIPQTVCGDPSRGRSNTHPSPFLCSQIFLCAAALRFPHEHRELDQWDVFGLFPRLASMWIYLSKSWMQYFFLFNRFWLEWASNPIQHSPMQWGTSHCPLSIPTSDTSWVIQCEGAGRLLASPSADVQVCLGSCPVCCSAYDWAHGLPEKRIWQVI